MNKQLNEEGLNLLFREARTHSYWIDEPVSDETLNELYQLMKWAPTSMNCTPARILFIRTPEAKQRLLPALSAGNVEKTMSAPVTAIIGHDFDFYNNMPRLFPQYPTAREMFAESPEIAETTAKRNGTLQGAYFIMAARALGLDCGPMSGFDNAKVDEEFFGAGSELESAVQEFFTTSHVKSNFLCNLGYADYSKVYPRNPRLEFDEVCRIL
ncbi:MAG TPA: malonic semialdehyde reductase [Armatimonadota bacterium]